MDWPKIVKEIRKTLLLTQTDLANLLGVSYATINRWENKHHKPTMAQKRQLKILCEKNNIEWKADYRE